eukprot:scaffold352799_cov56-Attheya_sp.AAC.2
MSLQLAAPAIAAGRPRQRQDITNTVNELQSRKRLKTTNIVMSHRGAVHRFLTLTTFQLVHCVSDVL